MLKLIFLTSLLSLISCSRTQNPEGIWQLNIKLQDQSLPVLISINKAVNGIITGTLYNGGEELNLEGQMSKDGLFELDIAAHYAKLLGKFTETNVSGSWVRTNKENYRLEFSGVKTSKKSLFEAYEKDASPFNIAGKWKISLGPNKTGLGVFKQKGARVQGAILTETGDYRFLDGHIKENKLILYGFDGVFSFVLDVILSEDEFVAQMYAGKSTHKKITGRRDENFHLADPYTLAKKTSDKALKLKLTSIDGNVIGLDQGEYKGRAKIIQLFGSWCPNCHDETRFFVNWRKKNDEKLQDLKFLALSFEREKTKAAAIKNLKRAKNKLNIDYDIVLADFDKSVKASDILPIKGTIAYPTTLYLNKKNEIIKIHSGFSGQATAQYFNEWVENFNLTIDQILL